MRQSIARLNSVWTMSTKRKRFGEALDEMTDARMEALPRDDFAPLSPEAETSLKRMKRAECAEDMGLALDRELTEALQANEAKDADNAAQRRQLDACRSLMRTLAPPDARLTQLCARAHERPNGLVEMLELLSLHRDNAQVVKVSSAAAARDRVSIFTRPPNRCRNAWWPSCSAARE